MSPIPQPESEILNAVADDTFLTDDLLRQLIGVGEVDLLVGISSHSNAEKTRNDFDAIERTFQQNFTRQRAVIVSIGGGDKAADETIKISTGVITMDGKYKNNVYSSSFSRSVSYERK